ncbi:hypothetical protein DUNSADRAFT_9685 [Dunaliella salina]|uniref:Uncharacterized protein n=1 Tax=Dunaliella salina TaxID=3046 RepID=A0ABQ7FTZ7_DUNSA|nr:hypothetical protein DUNSADRAFT_9685 [Dunaliella salina]|eukprot:KAF5825462.1 hypothetical protein DUNSADRAFT_9685 [Dunaliella salina]
MLSTLYGVEPVVGVVELQAQTLFQQAMLAENVKRREAQSSIFGVRTMKERRLDEQRIMQVRQPTQRSSLSQ